MSFLSVGTPCFNTRSSTSPSTLPLASHLYCLLFSVFMFIVFCFHSFDFIFWFSSSSSSLFSSVFISSPITSSFSHTFSSFFLFPVAFVHSPSSSVLFSFSLVPHLHLFSLPIFFVLCFLFSRSIFSCFSSSFSFVLPSFCFHFFLFLIIILFSLHYLFIVFVLCFQSVFISAFHLCLLFSIPSF